MTTGPASTAALDDDPCTAGAPATTRARWRRAARRVPWLAVVAFTLTTFALMPGPLLGLQTFGAVDMLEMSTPYRESLGRPPDVRSWFQTDQVEGFPQEIAFWRELRQGRFQSWSHVVAGGTPTGIFPFNGTLSPLSLGFAFLPAWYGLTLSAALALVVAQAGTYLFLRRLGVRGPVAILGAVAYAFAGANLVNLHRVTAPFVLPLLLWAVDRLVERPSWPRATAVAFVVAWTWLEGFPFAFVVSTAVALAWGLWRTGRRWWRAGRGRSGVDLLRRAAPVPAGVAWGVAVAAFSIWPTLWEISRRGTLDLRDYTGLHLPSIQLLGLFQGRTLGRWQEPLWTGEPFPSEAVTTVGLVVAIGVLAACVAAARGRLRLTEAGADGWAFWVVVAAVVTTIVFFGTPLLTLAEQVPGLAHNRLSRARFLVPLGLVVAASLWLDAWLTGAGADADRRHRANRGLAGLLLVGGTGALVWVVPRWVSKAHGLGELRATAGPVVVDLALTAMAVALIVVAHRRRRMTAPVVAALVALLWMQLAWPLREVTPAAPISDFYRPTAAHRALADLLGEDYRFAASGLFPYYSGSAQVHGLNDLRGFALRTDAARELVQAAAPEAFRRDNLKVVADAREWNLAAPVLDDLAVRYFVLGSNEFPLGALRGSDDSVDRWVATGDPLLSAEALRADGPITGIAVPLRADPSCSGRRLVVRLHSGGRELGVASRPAYDAIGTFTVFAIEGTALATGQAYGVTVDDPGCQVEVGVLDRPGGAVPARWEIGPDPAAPVRLVSATDGWVYERPTAQPLVRAHSRWRAFPDRGSLLAWLTTRPPDEADVAGYVGSPRADPGVPGAAPAVEDVQWRSQSVDLVVRGNSPSLAVVAQNADPGWSVEVDGRPAELVPVDGALLGVFVPPGHHHVSFAYHQPVLRRSTLVSVIAFAAMAVACVTRMTARRRRRPELAGGRRPTPQGP